MNLSANHIAQPNELESYMKRNFHEQGMGYIQCRCKKNYNTLTHVKTDWLQGKQTKLIQANDFGIMFVKTCISY